MENEKRKRPAARPSKQQVKKRGRAEKPAVTQGRRSKFTAMSTQTVNTSEDEDAATFQRQRCVQKCCQIKDLVSALYMPSREDRISTSMISVEICTVCCYMLCKCCYMATMAWLSMTRT